MKTVINVHAKKKLLLVSILASTMLIGCGEGTINPPGPRPGTAEQQTIRVPLNDTGVTYYIDNLSAEVSYHGLLDSTSSVWGDSVLIRTMIFPKQQGVEANFFSPWEHLGTSGTNREPIGNTTPLYNSEQDASIGRDAENDFFGSDRDLDGKAGFSFAKLDRFTGTELNNDAVEFGCVKDKQTGLTWEHKTAESSAFPLHKGSAVYSWYNPNSNTNGGDEGQIAGGNCSSEVISGDTLSFINTVNSSKLCGKTDWRLPTLEEMRSLVDYEKPGYAEPLIDLNFFPNLAKKEHRWTSQTHPQDSTKAYGFHFFEGLVQPHAKACTPLQQTNFLNGIVLVRNPD